MRESLVVDERRMPDPETRRIQEGEFRKGYDLVSGSPPMGSSLTPDQAAGIAPIPPNDQTGQSHNDEQ